MPNLDTTLVRRDLERIVAELKTSILQPEGFPERAACLSRLASEITVTYEAAFVTSVEMPTTRDGAVRRKDSPNQRYVRV